MKNNLKRIFLFSTLFSLVACGAGKQKECAPEHARDVLGNVLQRYDEPGYHVQAKTMCIKTTSFQFNIGGTTRYVEYNAKTKVLFCQEIEQYTYTGASNETYTSYYLFKEDKVVILDVEKLEYDEQSYEEFLSTYYSDYESFVGTKLLESYSLDDLPTLVGDLIFKQEKDIVEDDGLDKYKSFYGSDNEQSVQIEESQAYKNSRFIDAKINIKDELIQGYYYDFNFYEDGVLDVELKYECSVTFKATHKVPNYSKYAKTEIYL